MRMMLSYTSISHKNASSALAKLNACLHDVQEWMSLSKLKLNPEKNLVYCLWFQGSTSEDFTFLLAFLVAFFIRLILLEI